MMSCVQQLKFSNEKIICTFIYNQNFWWKRGSHCHFKDFSLISFISSSSSFFVCFLFSIITDTRDHFSVTWLMCWGNLIQSLKACTAQKAMKLWKLIEDCKCKRWHKTGWNSSCRPFLKQFQEFQEFVCIQSHSWYWRKRQICPYLIHLF